MGTATKLFAEIITEEKQKQVDSSRWGNSTFEEIDELKNDHSGRAGEKWVHEMCEFLNVPNEYNEDEVNQDNGTYDIGIKSKIAFKNLSKVELKKRNKVLETYIKSLSQNKKKIIRENVKDIKACKREELIDRLIIDEKKIESIRNSINQIVKF